MYDRAKSNLIIPPTHLIMLLVSLGDGVRYWLMLGIYLYLQTYKTITDLCTFKASMCLQNNVVTAVATQWTLLNWRWLKIDILGTTWLLLGVSTANSTSEAAVHSAVGESVYSIFYTKYDQHFLPCFSTFHSHLLPWQTTVIHHTLASSWSSRSLAVTTC